MQKSFEERRKAYLEKIEIEYHSPPPKSIWSKPVPEYKEIWEYARKYKGTTPNDGHVILKKHQGWLTIPVAIIFQLILWRFDWPDGWLRAVGCILLFVAVIAIVKLIEKLPGTRPLLRIDTAGIHFLDEQFCIKWEHVLRIVIRETTDSDGTSTCIIIHAYDERYDYFRAFEGIERKLKVTTGQLCCYLEHFSALHQQQHMKK